MRYVLAMLLVLGLCMTATDPAALAGHFGWYDGEHGRVYNCNPDMNPYHTPNAPNAPGANSH